MKRMSTRSAPAFATHRRFGRWLVSAAAIFAAALLLSTLWVWIDIGTDYLGGVRISIGHGTITLEQTDSTFTWANGGAARPDLPAHAWSSGDPDSPRQALYTSCTMLGDLPGYTLRDRMAFLKWRPEVGSVSYLVGSGRRWFLDLPLWIPFLAAAAFTVIAWRRHFRRQAESHIACPSCGYDLRGLADAAPCPECGGTDAPAQPITIS
jgi:hypothetical protein